jgi:hypothetical protein
MVYAAPLTRKARSPARVTCSGLSTATRLAAQWLTGHVNNLMTHARNAAEQVSAARWV